MGSVATTPAGRTRARLTRNAPCWTATPRGLLHANAPEERMSMRVGGVSTVSLPQILIYMLVQRDFAAEMKRIR